MELRIKEEYLEWSIGGGRVGKTKLKNIPADTYEKLYREGFKEFFYEVKPTPSKVEESPLEDKKKGKKDNDFNQPGGDQETIF